MTLSKTNYVDKAEEVISRIEKGRNGKPRLTTSKIRSILVTSATIYDKVRRGKGPLTENEIADVQFLRMKLVYEYGRGETGVRDFIDCANLIPEIKQINDDRDQLIVFCKYLEALVAYHRFVGGND